MIDWLDESLIRVTVSALVGHENRRENLALIPTNIEEAIMGNYHTTEMVI